VAEALLEHEVIDAPQLKQLLAGEPLTVKPAPKPVAPPPVRDARAEEERPSGAGLLPPPVPKPTS
jgi:hypothetical protein